MWTEQLNQSGKIALQISPSWIDDYCNEMRRSTATVEKRLVALDALLTFISTAVTPASIESETYEQIKAILSTHIEQARTELMNESALHLLRAFEQHDVALIARLFSSLSRSGFWEVLTQTMSRMEETLREDVSRWAVTWVDEATQRGEKASPYPDTMDFAEAGINIAEYTAMIDVCKYVKD